MKHSLSSYYKKAGIYSLSSEPDRLGINVEIIEGDDIYIEYTNVKHLSGKNIVIGPGCTVERADYIDKIVVDDKSTVKNIVNSTVTQQ